MAMSTPINKLPSQSNTQPIANAPPTSEDDPFVTDVISEMENEFAVSNPPRAAHAAAPTPTPALGASSGYAPPFQHGPYPTPSPTISSHAPSSYIDIAVAKRATICAVVALVLFYPFETGMIYEKLKFLAQLQPYERVVRALLLAILIYVLLLKLDI